MNDELKEKVQARIAQLSEELAAYVEQANRQIAAQQGAIQALEMLLGDLAEADEAAEE